jgi:hypothetical protein
MEMRQRRKIQTSISTKRLSIENMRVDYNLDNDAGPSESQNISSTSWGTHGHSKDISSRKSVILLPNVGRQVSLAGGSGSSQM